MTTRTTTAAPPLARLLVAGSGIMMLANSISIPFLAVFLRRELGLEPGTIGFIVGSSVFFAIFAGLVGGSVSDVLGRTPLLLLSLLGVVVSFIGFYLSHSLVSVFVFNATLSLSSSSFGPVAKALLSDLLPQERRVKWFSYQYLAVNIGFSAGPMIGAFTGLSGGRETFLIAAAVYVGYFVLLGSAILLRPSGAAGPTRRTTEESKLFGQVLEGLRGSFRALATDRTLLCLIIAGLLLEAVHSKISGVLAQHLSLGFEDGVKILSYLLTTNAVTVVLFQLLASRISQRLEPVRSIVLGGLLMFGGMAGFGLSGQAWQFIVAMVVFSIGETFIIPAEFAIIDRIAPEDRRGSYFGAQTIAQLGGFVGPFAGGLILAWYGGTAMFFVLGSFALFSVLIYLVVGRRIPGLTRREEHTARKETVSHEQA
ncbi:MFS transporter [Streptomyces sp. NBC_00539]|uniref:MFS transporter n=1 Tax=Streptomyces sp. NBC_00539 TaxID=2975770 RepID=UPI002E810D17|nr:MFS transporter [Streptomyces sp. NBC_00539]WUC63117.1 MFS transporter [Streptomyces sp. NBC_00539]